VDPAEKGTGLLGCFVNPVKILQGISYLQHSICRRQERQMLGRTIPLSLAHQELVPEMAIRDLLGASKGAFLSCPWASPRPLTSCDLSGESAADTRHCAGTQQERKGNAMAHLAPLRCLPAAPA
jgi:hypothetical protein